MQQIGTAAGGTADALRFQRLLEIPASASGRTKQDHNVLGAHRTKAVPLPDGRSRPKHFGNPLCHKGRFLRVLVFPGFDHVQLHGGVQLYVRNSLPERLRLTVDKPADLGPHTGTKHVVHRVDDLSAGTEIVAQQNLSALLWLSLAGWHIIPVFLQKYPRIGQTELVDGLLYIAHQETVLSFPGQRIENCILHTVGILVFVHQDLPVAPSDFQCGSSGICSGFSQQQIQCSLLQIAEIQAPAAAFRGGVIPIKLAHQRHQSPLRRRGLNQVRENLP